MQPKFQNEGQYPSSRLLQKCTSMPAFSESTNSSTNSIDSPDDCYRQLAIRWILAFSKKVAKDTQYLAISLLNRLNRLAPHALPLTEQSHERVALATLLIASKMNEIYPPKISQLAAKCRRLVRREEVLEMEASILEALEFEVALEETVFTHLHRILGCLYGDKLEECEKLYRMVASRREVYEFGEEIAAYALIYLIIPDFVRKMKLRENGRIKALAIKIYNIYSETKQQYEREKENRNNLC
jgi:hypothetical protein